MGLRTDLRTFAQPGVPMLAAALTVAAIAGKQLCALGFPLRGANRLAIGIGMTPRGEVGLIFADVGLGLSIHGEPIISRAVFSAIVVMVIVTTRDGVVGVVRSRRPGWSASWWQVLPLLAAVALVLMNGLFVRRGDAGGCTRSARWRRTRSAIAGPSAAPDVIEAAFRLCDIAPANRIGAWPSRP